MITEAKIELYPEILALHEATFSTIGETGDMLIEDLNSSDLFVWVGPRGAIGYATIKFGDPESYLGWFAVSTNECSRGVGTALLDFVEKHVQSLGSFALSVDCRECFSKALCMYRKRDYKEVGRKRDLNGEEVIRLRKALT